MLPSSDHCHLNLAPPDRQPQQLQYLRQYPADIPGSYWYAQKCTSKEIAHRLPVDSDATDANVGYIKKIGGSSDLLHGVSQDFYGPISKRVASLHDGILMSYYLEISRGNIGIVVE